MAELPDTDRGLVEEIARRWALMPDPSVTEVARIDQHQAHLRDRLAAGGIDLTDPTVAATVLRTLMVLGEEAAQEYATNRAVLTARATALPGRSLVLATTHMSTAGWVMRTAAEQLRGADDG